MSTRMKIGILGASGYTGADAVRLLARHPGVEITALTANTHAGKMMDEVFPHFFMLDLPRLVEWEKVDWTRLDAVFCGLPHGTTQEIIAAVLAANPAIKTLIEEVKFPVATWSQWEYAISKNGGSTTQITKLADDWLAGNKPQFEQWVAAASKVR